MLYILTIILTYCPRFCWYKGCILQFSKLLSNNFYHAFFFSRFHFERQLFGLLFFPDFQSCLNDYYIGIIFLTLPAAHGRTNHSQYHYIRTHINIIIIIPTVQRCTTRKMVLKITITFREHRENAYETTIYSMSTTAVF